MVRRQEMLKRLAETIISIQCSHPLRVAIDGIDAAGKTRLANEMVSFIEEYGRPVIRASIDGFHRPRQERYRQGVVSPRGYYEDSFDYVALKEFLLFPLGPAGSRYYRRAIFDVRKDIPLASEEEYTAPESILLVDGVFLLRAELMPMWDYRIFVNVDIEMALQRAMQRDLSLFGSSEAVEIRYRQRYIPGQQLYFQLAHPEETADVVVENNDPADPQLVFSPYG